MKANYGNWVPKRLIIGFLMTGALLTGMACMIHQSIVRILLTISGIALCASGLWMCRLHRAFSYEGKRQLSRKIVEGVAEYVNIPDGGIGLDVGCGSGALTIACARRNPGASMIGVDRWGKEYSEYNQKLCEDNAKAEGISNVSFRHGDACRLDFEEETFDTVTSNYVYHNIVGKNRQDLLLETLRVLKKGGTFAIHDLMSTARYGNMDAFMEKLTDMGYEEVKLVDTTDRMFTGKKEALFMDLAESRLLVGRK